MRRGFDAVHNVYDCYKGLQMIKYRFPEELEFATYYANKLNDSLTVQILNSGKVNNSAEAIHLSQFFWKMVDAAVVDHQQKIDLPWPESSEFWCEKLMNSFSGYLDSVGYEKEWDEVSDQQDA